MRPWCGTAMCCQLPTHATQQAAVMPPAHPLGPEQPQRPWQQQRQAQTQQEQRQEQDQEEKQLCWRQRAWRAYPSTGSCWPGGWARRWRETRSTPVLQVGQGSFLLPVLLPFLARPAIVLRLRLLPAADMHLPLQHPQLHAFPRLQIHLTLAQP